MCLQLRANLMNVFYYLPYVNEFIVDILVGCPSQQVRPLFDRTQLSQYFSARSCLLAIVFGTTEKFLTAPLLLIIFLSTIHQLHTQNIKRTSLITGSVCNCLFLLSTNDNSNGKRNKNKEGNTMLNQAKKIVQRSIKAGSVLSSPCSITIVISILLGG